LSLKHLLLCAVALFLTSTEIFAQRGASFDGSATPSDSLTQGFPGYFDTNVARKGSLVVEFPPMLMGLVPTPFTAVDYGVSDTLTVGTNAVLTTLPWLFGVKGASLKIRSLVVGDHAQQGSATYYTGGLSASQGSTTANMYYHLFTWNHSWSFREIHQISLHGNYTRINFELGTTKDLNHQEINLSTMQAGAGYGYRLNHKWGFRINGVTSILQSIELDNAGASIVQSSNPNKIGAATSIAVAQFDLRSRPDWLFGFGAIGFSVSGVSTAAPWFTWATRW
jgi:hypothetical protein